jgi:hypothetical protein
MTINPLLEAALHYAQLGLPVAPLHVYRDGQCSCGDSRPHKVGKHPRTPHGVRDATIMAGQIRTWWRWWVNANIAGAMPRGVYVLEIDSAAGVMALHERGVTLEGAPRVRTGRDELGLHLWYRSPLALPNCPDGIIAPDVGFRGFGEYVLMPPSLHPTGRRYTWEVPFSGPLPSSLPELPPTLVVLVQRAQGPRSHGNGRLWQSAFTPVPPGQQAITLLSLAHAAMRFVPREQWPVVIPALLAGAARQFPLGDPAWPWTTADLARIYEQASRRVDPVPLPPEPPGRRSWSDPDDRAAPPGRMIEDLP